ncbi:MAG: PPOX class F420-dependent oxidoreductase [Jatrophihabitans sp.]|uniref:PPOX class F420-dependent oxidoreductase n=1 Tax=Jatrophihabitans sp. TaxID=1932789 RepID=UPI003F7F8594
MPLSEHVVALAKGPNPATVVTLMPDGQPQALITWIDTDGEHLLVNTEPQRQKVRNARRDPKVTVSIMRHDNQFDWAEVRGELVREITGDEARAHIDELSRRYVSTDYRMPVGPEGRVILVIAPKKVNESPS